MNKTTDKRPNDSQETVITGTETLIGTETMVARVDGITKI